MSIRPFGSSEGCLELNRNRVRNAYAIQMRTKTCRQTNVKRFWAICVSSSFRHRRCSHGFQHLHQLIQFRGAEQAIRPVRRDVGERGFIEPIRGDNSVLREVIDDGPLGKYSELNDLDSELRARDVLRTCSPAVVGAGGSNS